MAVNINQDSPKYIEAKNSLPEELQPIYVQLVEEYAFHTTKHFGKGYVAYNVLADLVKDGWRLHKHNKD